MLTNKTISTPRLKQFVRFFRESGTPVFFIHGNGSGLTPIV
jgi:DNA repair exonuclease SbcCD nuclease subunit